MAYKVNVFGTGPAGLMAAQTLAEAGVKVRLCDHKPAPARKFLLAGRGGLNLTHSEPLEIFLSRYGDARTKLEKAVRAFPPQAVRGWCEALGQETFVGSSGRVFPRTMKASPLLRSLLGRLRDLGVEYSPRTAWTEFSDQPTILALGGASWPELGSDAAWVPVFQKHAIAVSPFVASNARQSVAWSPAFSDRHAGQPIKNVAITCGGRTVRGEVMISRDGLEGGAIYALSKELRSVSALTLNLKPDLSLEQISARLTKRRPKDSRSTFLRKVFGLSPAAIALMKECRAESPVEVRINTGGASDLRRAISSAGGVAWSEVCEDFSLKAFPATFVVGEMLDWDAPTGGYLLQACFSTARFAAQAMVKRWAV